MVVAEQGAEPADRIEGIRLAGRMAGQAVQFQGLPSVVERLAVAALPFKRRGETVMGAALAGLVAELPVQLQGAVLVGVGIGVGAQSYAGDAENTVGTGLLGQVAEALRRGQPDGLDGDVVGLDRFGASAPGPKALAELGFSAENVAARARALLK